MAFSSQEIKRCLGAGLLVIVPLVITVYVLEVVVSVMDGLLHLLGPLHPDNFLPFHVPGLGVILALFVTFLAGLTTRHYLGSRLIKAWERLLSRIPLVRGLYGATKQLLEAICGHSDSLKRVVLVEFPRPGMHTIGFVTGQTRGEVQEHGRGLGEVFINIFVPHTPNPTGGLYLVVPESQTVPLSMTVEEAFKLIISGGIVAPAETEKLCPAPSDQVELPRKAAGG